MSSLSVDVIKVSQDVSLSTGQTENFLVLELPNGSVVRARVNEAAAQAVMGCSVNGSASMHRVNQEDDAFDLAAPESPPPGFRETTAPDGSSALEFGGEPPPRQRPRQVAADAQGNPMSARDPGEIASSGADEDGVGQV